MHVRAMNKQSTKNLMTLLHCGLVLFGALVCTSDKAFAFPVSTGANPYKTHITPEKGNVAIFGYDPVAYFIEGRAVKGKDEFEHEFGDVRWRFSSADNRDAFIDNPDGYLPRYGGFCTVCIVENEGLFDGNPKIWTIVKGKLYLNNDLRSREKFRRNASLYIEWADAMWGKLAAPAVRRISDPNAQKIAVFPMLLGNRSNPYSQDTESAIKDQTKSYLDASESFEIAYHYESAPAGGPVVTPEQVWSGGFGPGEPDLDSVTQLAEQIGVGGVVMAYARPGVRGRVTLYVFDLDLGNVYKEKGFVSEFDYVLQSVFSDFIAGRKQTSSSTRKIAVFPPALANPTFSLAQDTESAVVGMIKSYLDANESFEILYDYETTPASGPAVNPTQVWTGGFGPQEPQLEVVTKLAEQIGVEGVVMAWVRSADTALSVEQGRVELYVIDLVQGDIYKESGLVSEVDNMLKIAFSKLRS